MKLIEQQDQEVLVRGAPVLVRHVRLDASEWQRVTVIGWPSRRNPGALQWRHPNSDEWSRLNKEALVEDALALQVAFAKDQGEIARVWHLEILEGANAFPQRLFVAELVGENWTLDHFAVEGVKTGPILSAV